MLRISLSSLALASGVLLLSSSANAFDPFTAMSAINGIVGTVSSIGKGVEAAAEIAELAGAMTELAGEVSDETELSASTQHLLDELHEIESLASEPEFTKEEVDQLLSRDRTNSTTLSEKVRLITRSIKTAKKIYKLTKRSLQKAAEYAAIDGSRAERDLVNVETQRMVREVGEDLAEKKRFVRAVRDAKKLVRQDAQYRKKMVGGSAPHLPGNAFPIQTQRLEEALGVYDRFRAVFAVIIGVLLVLRVLSVMASLGGSEELWEVVGDLFKCVMLLVAFPHFFRLIFQCSGTLAEETTRLFQVPPVPRAGDEASAVHLIASFLGPLGAFKGYLVLVTEATKGLIWLIQAITFHLVGFLFTLLMMIGISIGPIFIVLGTMFRVTSGLKGYVLGILVVSLWPVIWALIGGFGSALWTNSSSDLSTLIYAVGIGLFQILLPFGLAAMLSTGTAMATATKGIGIGKRAVALATNVHGPIGTRSEGSFGEMANGMRRAALFSPDQRQKLSAAESPANLRRGGYQQDDGKPQHRGGRGSRAQRIGVPSIESLGPSGDRPVQANQGIQKGKSEA